MRIAAKILLVAYILIQRIKLVCSQSTCPNLLYTKISPQEGGILVIWAYLMTETVTEHNCACPESIMLNSHFKTQQVTCTTSPPSPHHIQRHVASNYRCKCFISTLLTCSKIFPVLWYRQNSWPFHIVLVFVLLFSIVSACSSSNGWKDSFDWAIAQRYPGITILHK